MIFLSAGHHDKDPGAIANGVKEADLTVELRDLSFQELIKIGANVTMDKNFETLSQYLARIKPGSGSVVCEIHFNAAAPQATGVETIVKAGASAAEKRLAERINSLVGNATGLVNRGVKDETQSHRGRLAILHTKAGISVLPEICFITNKNDLQLYRKGMRQIAKDLARALKDADDLYT